MAELREGDRVRFKPEALKISEKDDYLDRVHMRMKEKNKIYTVAKVNLDGNVFLEGYEDILFNSDLFIRICSRCLKKKVFFQIRSFDTCFDCAKARQNEMLEKVRAVLLPDQVAVFEEYRKATETFQAMMDMD